MCGVLQLDLWDRALVLAPAVLQAYWRSLLQRKADMLSKAAAPAKDLLPCLLVSGQVASAVEMLMRQQQLELAANVAAVGACG